MLKDENERKNNVKMGEIDWKKLTDFVTRNV